MKNDKKWFWLVLGALVIITVGWLVLRWLNRDIVLIKTAQVGRGAIEQVVTASGIVDAPIYELGPKIGGKIMQINVKEGDRVYEGETLAEFDDTTRLVAPAGGVVAKVNYDIGETVTPAQPAIVVVNYNKSWVETQIDEIDIGSVKIGDRVRVTSDVYPDKIFEGEIYWIAPLAELRKVGGRVKLDEESYVFPCKVKFLGKHDKLFANMSVNVDITAKRKENALIVPREALVSKDDSTLVYRVNKGQVREVKIEIGIRSYTSVEATAGLSDGDSVAISNTPRLKDRGRIAVEQP